MLVSMPALALLLGACIAVDRDMVQMSDLIPDVAPEGAGLSLGYAPVPGARRQFTAFAMNHVLARHGLAPYSGPDVCVERMGRQLDEVSVKAAVMHALASPQAKVEIVAMDTKPIPAGSLEFPLGGLVPPSPLSPDEPALWRGRVRVSLERSIPIWVKVRLQVPVTRLVALEPLPNGAAIQASQVRSEVMLDKLPSDGAALTPAEVEGWRPKRNIKPGEALRAQWLQPPLLVRRGETVHASTEHDGVRIRLDTIVESDGKKGDRVKIRSPFGSGLLSAVVESEGAVTILPGGVVR